MINIVGDVARAVPADAEEEQEEEETAMQEHYEGCDCEYCEVWARHEGYAWWQQNSADYWSETQGDGV